MPEVVCSAMAVHTVAISLSAMPWLRRKSRAALALSTSNRLRDHPTARRSPWQNGHAERLIGSIRRECLDHIVVFGEAHLRRILAAYAVYYNELRTHLSLGKDSPRRRQVQRLGQLAAQPILGGLHHQYCRM
jgi:transposase InsO family protein